MASGFGAARKTSLEQFIGQPVLRRFIHAGFFLGVARAKSGECGCRDAAKGNGFFDTVDASLEQ